MRAGSVPGAHPPYGVRVHEPVPATGRQFEISSGSARAVITEVGAALREYEVDGVPHVETYDAD